MTRYLALDAFRGLTIALMILVNTPGTWSHVYPPLLHAYWHGATLADLVFPFFMFVIGSAMFFSFKKSHFLATPSKFLSILLRAFILFSIGFIHNIIPFDTPVDSWRIMGVLQRIGIVYLFAASAVLLLNRQGVFIVCIVILFAYWAVITSVGGIGLTREGNIVRHLDLAILGVNHMYTMNGISFEPEGLLSSIPAVVSVLLGFEVTRYVVSEQAKKMAVLKLMLIGVTAVIVGVLWGKVFPINKGLWTSSYVIYATGFACILLATLMWIIDIKGQGKLMMPLCIYGTNPLFIYVLSFLLVTLYLYVPMDGGTLYRWLYQQFTHIAQPTLASFLFAIFHVVLFWFVSLYLYRRKLFIKI